MTPSSPPPATDRPSARRWIVRLAPGAVAALAIHLANGALAGLPSVSPADAAELRFLSRATLVVLLALLPAAMLWPGRGRALGWSAALLLGGALLWLLPPGPLRGAAVSSVLVLGFVLLALGALVPGRAFARAGDGEGSALSAIALVPAALALQALALPEELLRLGHDSSSLARLIALPILGCGAAALIARRQGVEVAATTVVVALAIGGRFSTWVLAALLVPAVAPTLVDERRATGTRLLALAALAAPLAFDLLLGSLTLLGALAFAGRRAWPAALVVAVGLLALGPVQRPWLAAAALVPLLLMVSPASVFAPSPSSTGRARDGGSGRQVWRLAVPLLLAWIGLRFGEPGAALVVPAVLLASRLGDATPSLAGSRSWRLGWPALWLAGSLLATAYPWLREPGAPTVVGLLGLDRPAGLLIAAALAVVLLAAVTARRVVPAASPARWALPVALALLLAVPLARLGDAVFALTWPAVELGPTHRSWESAPLSAPGGPTTLVVDSAVAFGAGVEAGERLAVARWIPALGSEPVRSVSLRQGLDTREWTAPPAPGDGADAAAVAPWISLVSPDGLTFVHRYRAHRELGELAAGEGRLVVELASGVPDAVRLSLYRLTLRAGPRLSSPADDDRRPPP